MIVRYYNANILTNEGIVKGDLVIYDNIIASVAQENVGVIYDKEIDVKGNLIIPTFKNAHTHSPMTFLRNAADDMSLSNWLNDRVFPLEAHLDEEKVYWFQKLAILEYLRNGIGLISDMYFYRDPIAFASAECGIRNTLVFGVSDEVEKTMKLEEALDYTELLKEANKNKKSKLIDGKIGLHAEYTCSMPILERVCKIANEEKSPVFLHMSETKNEVEKCIEKYNKTPVQLFEDLGLFNYGATLYHMVYPSDSDLNIIQKRNINIVSCPSSNLKLASGIAPLKKMLDMKINVALGTDGPASNNALDMFREMYLAACLQKGINLNAEAVDAKTALNMATINGAKAVGRKGLEGIKAGQYADFVIIDINSANMRPQTNLLSSLVYSCGVSNVLTTVVDGNILYDKGEYFIGEDVEKIYRMSEFAAKEILGKVNA